MNTRRQTARDFTQPVMENWSGHSESATRQKSQRIGGQRLSPPTKKKKNVATVRLSLGKLHGSCLHTRAHAQTHKAFLHEQEGERAAPGVPEFSRSP